MATATVFYPPQNSLARDTGWQLSLEGTALFGSVLENQLPAAVETNPQVLLLPLVSEPESGWSPWQLFPERLAVLLSPVPRDVVFACNAVAREAITSHGRSPKSAWEWLLAAVEARVTITRLSPQIRPPSTEWQRQLPDLAPRRPGHDCHWLLAALRAASVKSLLPQSRDPISEIALQAGIFQWHDYLEESHTCSQQIEGEGPGQLGDYWHGIMHRREPDASNAKYWFRNVGKQRIFPEVARSANWILARCKSTEAPRWREKVVAGGNWDPFAFIDLCSACENRHDDIALAARHIQYAEMSLLMKETWRAASSS